jgi:recA bacterial DNA recombination protein
VGVCAFVDAEHSMDPSYARATRVDTGQLIVSQPHNGEQALEIADVLVRSGAVDVVAIDSVAALTPQAEPRSPIRRAGILGRRRRGAAARARDDRCRGPRPHRDAVVRRGRPRRARVDSTCARASPWSVSLRLRARTARTRVSWIPTAGDRPGPDTTEGPPFDGPPAKQSHSPEGLQDARPFNEDCIGRNGA